MTADVTVRRKKNYNRIEIRNNKIGTTHPHPHTHTLPTDPVTPHTHTNKHTHTHTLPTDAVTPHTQTNTHTHTLPTDAVTPHTHTHTHTHTHARTADMFFYVLFLVSLLKNTSREHKPMLGCLSLAWLLITT